MILFRLFKFSSSRNLPSICAASASNCRLLSVSSRVSHLCRSLKFTGGPSWASFLVASRPAVLNATNRFIAKKTTSKLSFEAEAAKATATRDVTVFTYTNDRFFKILTGFGIVQFLFWANIGVFFYTVPMAEVVKGKNEHEQNNTGSWWSTFSSWQSRYRNRMAIGCFGLGFLVLMFAWIYPVRTITNLTLLKGGNQLRIATYGHFGRSNQFTVPLDSVSCYKSRQASGVQISMKISGRPFYYLLDTREGQFVEPLIFDQVVGLNRTLK